MCVSVYVGMYACVYVCVYVCMCAYMCVCVFMCVFMCACMCVCAYMQGRRSKIEIGEAKYYCQLLASIVNRIGNFYSF